MTTGETFATRTRSFLEDKASGTLLGILCVFGPLVLVGVFGESLGAGTSLSSAVIFLAYALAIGIATLVMRTWGWNWRTVGLGRPANTRRTVFQAVATLLISVLAVILLQIIVLLVAGPGGPASDQSEYNPISGNLPNLLAALVAAWTLVTFGEEMVFRGFLLNAVRRLLPETRATTAMAVVGSASIFGLAHYAWGWFGVVETALFGLVLAIAYLRSGRNLWVTIVAHALVNTLKYLVIFSGVA